MRFPALVLILSVAAVAQEGPQVRTAPGPGGPGPERRADRRIAEAEPKVERPTKAELKLAAELIDRAQALTNDLNDTDRAYVLAKIAELTAKRDPQTSKTRAEEAFKLAANANDSASSQIQMSAMMAVSQNDLDRALQMLSEMPAQRPRADGSAAPDIRGAAATMLFTRAFTKEGMASVEKLQSAARQMGENGFYPYMAVAQVLRGVGEKDKDRAQTIAMDAVAFVNRRQLSGMESQQITMFLRSAREFISRPMMKEILERIVKEALETAKQSDGTQVAASFESEDGQSAQLNSMATLMIFQLMPMIRDVDPDWAKQLEDQSEELKRVAALMGSGQRTSIMIGARNTGGPNGPNGGDRDFRDELQAMSVDELASRDPQRAMETAQSIKDPTVRVAAIARASAAGTDEAAKEKALKDAKDALAQATDPRDKLTILSGLAQAQAALKDEEGLATTLQQSFVLADDMFRRSVDRTPAGGAWMRPGVQATTSMVRAGARKSPKIFADKIDGVRHQPLKALLLLSAAEALDPESRSNSGPQFRFQFSN
jgi:hypothetical protein